MWAPTRPQREELHVEQLRRRGVEEERVGEIMGNLQIFKVNTVEKTQEFVNFYAQQTTNKSPWQLQKVRDHRSQAISSFDSIFLGQTSELPNPLGRFASPPGQVSSETDSEQGNFMKKWASSQVPSWFSWIFRFSSLKVVELNYHGPWLFSQNQN